MSLFSKFRGFIHRHRNKFLVGGVVVAGSVLLTRYAQQRLKEWQEREMKEFLDRTRKQQHYESIGRTCNQTILNLTNTLQEEISKLINTDELIEELRNSSGNSLEMWNTLKVLLFSKVGCIVYANVMLVITLRIQLSLIGGHLYKNANSISTEMQEQYLLLCQNLLTTGLKKLSAMIQEECKNIMSNVDLKKQLRLTDIEALFGTLQGNISSNCESPIDNFRGYLMTNGFTSDNEMLSNLMRDTSDLLDSDEIKILANHCVARGFTLMGDHLLEFYNINGTKISEVPANSTEDFIHMYEAKKPLAKVLPIINGLLAKNSYPEQFVQKLIINDKIQALGANVYESLL